MRAIVFGGSGFLGSHVADCLTRRGHEVVIYDRLSSPYLMPGQAMVTGDILDEALVSATVRGADVVYNFAGIADIGEASQRPRDCVRLNVYGNSVILEACRAQDVGRYVFASSLYVYSRSGGFYRASKQASELIIQSYQEVFGLPYTILRYGSLYGPRADHHNAIHSFIQQALTESRIVRHGNGEELREYIHVLDAAEGSVDILADEFVNQHVILTGCQQMKVRDVLTMIREILGNRIDLEFVAHDCDNNHYQITPYSFAPKVGRRLSNRCYVDLGQGILNLIHEMYADVWPGSQPLDDMEPGMEPGAGFQGQLMAREQLPFE